MARRRTVAHGLHSSWSKRSCGQRCLLQMCESMMPYGLFFEVAWHELVPENHMMAAWLFFCWPKQPRQPCVCGQWLVLHKGASARWVAGRSIDQLQPVWYSLESWAPDMCFFNIHMTTYVFIGVFRCWTGLRDIHVEASLLFEANFGKLGLVPNLLSRKIHKSI